MVFQSLKTVTKNFLIKIFEEKFRVNKNYIKILSSTKNVSNYIDEAIKLIICLLPDQVLSYSDILSMRNSLK